MKQLLLRIALLLAVALPSAFAFAADALIKKDTVVGTGREALGGTTVVVNYTGWLHNPSAPDLQIRQLDRPRAVLVSAGCGPRHQRLG